MIKTIKIQLLSLCCMVLCCMGNLAAQDIVASGICYNIIGERQVEVAPAIVNGENRYQGSVILPEKVYCDGVNYDVTAIAPRAFWQSGVTEVQIPNCVTTIGEAAFADAEELRNITLPLNLTTVSRYMLAGTAVANVVVPERVTEVGEGAFEDCSRLRTVYLPASLRRVGRKAFAYCHNLREIYCDASTPPAMPGEDIFEDCGDISVMLADGGTSRRFQNDPIWGNEDVFSLWIDEGLAVSPRVEQEQLGEHWTTLTLGGSLAYKIYGPDGYLTAVTAADRYFLPISAAGDNYLVVPTTLMRDEEDRQRVVTTAPAAVIEDDVVEDKPQINIVGLDGTIYIGGDTHGLWTFVYDVYGNLWYERPAVNNWISLPGPRVYIVKVGDTVRKVFLN